MPFLRIDTGYIALCVRAPYPSKLFVFSTILRHARHLIFSDRLMKVWASFVGLRESAQEKPSWRRALRQGAIPAHLQRELTFLFHIRFFHVFSSCCCCRWLRRQKSGPKPNRPAVPQVEPAGSQGRLWRPHPLGGFRAFLSPPVARSQACTFLCGTSCEDRFSLFH